MVLVLLGEGRNGDSGDTKEAGGEVEKVEKVEMQKSILLLSFSFISFTEQREPGQAPGACWCLGKVR